VSRRRPERPARGKPTVGRPTPPEPGPAPARPGLATQIGVLAIAFALGVGAAELFGAANLGVAFGVGQVVFALVLVALLIRRG
jgi:hypothetical protein